MTINQRISTNFVAIFVVFALIIILFTVRYEKSIATDKLSAQLATYTHLFQKGYDVVQLADTSLYINTFDNTGKVTYNNKAGMDSLPDILDQKEMRMALRYGIGTSLRHSTVNRQLYFFYATKVKELANLSLIRAQHFPLIMCPFLLRFCCLPWLP